MLAGDQHQLDQEIARLAEIFDTNVTFSHLCRAWMMVMRQIEPALEQLSEQPFPKRPPHDAPESIREYDRRWANLLMEAVRRTPAIPALTNRRTTRPRVERTAARS